MTTTDPYAKYRPASNFCTEVAELVQQNEAKDKLLNVQKHQMNKLLTILSNHGLMEEYLNCKEA